EQGGLARAVGTHEGGDATRHRPVDAAKGAVIFSDNGHAHVVGEDGGGLELRRTSCVDARDVWIVPWRDRRWGKLAGTLENEITDEGVDVVPVTAAAVGEKHVSIAPARHFIDHFGIIEHDFMSERDARERRYVFIEEGKKFCTHFLERRVDRVCVQ